MPLFVLLTFFFGVVWPQFVDAGKVKKIRGVAYALRTSPTMTNRMVEAAKGVLLKFLPDVFVLTDHRKGPASGLSPGFGITLTAETTTGNLDPPPPNPKFDISSQHFLLWTVLILLDHLERA